MPKLPRLTGRELLTLLRREGFEVQRSRGSHFILAHPDGRRTVVPVHAGEVLGPGLLSRILRDCDLSRERLLQLV
jgi:predicted RNA binding protein YcfA (HicA-like mRNA interferase family)